MARKVLRRDAKIQRFISKHLNTERRNLVNNDENRVCDVQIISYEITDDQQKHAVLTLERGLQIEASFVEFDKSKKRRAMRCFTATRQVYHQSILAPLFLTYNVEKEKILLFYERYDTLFESWNRGNETWWKQAICEQLRAIKYLQDRGFIHTGLADPRNFVIKDNKLKMLNITSTLQNYLKAHQDTNEVTIKRNSFKSLRNLMWPQYVQKKATTRDDEAFFDLFDRDDISFEIYVEKLITHPYAKDFRQCMSDFNDIYLLDQQKRLIPPLNEVTQSPIFDTYRGWITRIKDSKAIHLKKALPGGAGVGERSKFGEQDVDTLIKLLRNINEHRGVKRNAVDRYFEIVYKEVKKLFPGLLAVIHQEIRVQLGT